MVLMAVSITPPPRVPVPNLGEGRGDTYHPCYDTETPTVAKTYMKTFNRKSFKQELQIFDFQLIVLKLKL